jgi:uncharacterized protein CbrC (UPF0167 family)
VPREIVTQLLTRTPGFSGWQQERWLDHCADPAMLHPEGDITGYLFRFHHCGAE